ncbi:hypothetical protein LCGC14_1824340 [marine sediment metagenome]|uniref:Uncharacterized protein n=1 Tax=marine sediment metagenome TaxID=412755 RepID=A0A0F9IXQ4_9ZZZZ
MDNQNIPQIRVVAVIEDDWMKIIDINEYPPPDNIIVDGIDFVLKSIHRGNSNLSVQVESQV